MSNPFNGSKRGMRGGSADRPSRKTHSQHIEQTKRPDQSCTALVADAGIFLECSEIQESAEDYLIPRQSLTNKLHLRLFPNYITETEVSWQTDKLTGQRVRVTNPIRVKTDSTLLQRGMPFQMPKDIKRITAHTKRMKGDNEKAPINTLTDQNGKSLTVDGKVVLADTLNTKEIGLDQLDQFSTPSNSTPLHDPDPIVQAYLKKKALKDK
jgi:hypothetical protein